VAWPVLAAPFSFEEEKMAHVHNPKGLENGWYITTSNSNLRCGFMIFKPGTARMVTVRERVKCGRGFDLSLENGKLSGPFGTREEAESGKNAPAAKKEAAAPAPAPEPEAAPEPAPEPEPTPDPDPDATLEMSGGIMDVTAEGAAVVSSEGDAPKKKRRRKRKSED
jgi:hypothetical protein